MSTIRCSVVATVGCINSDRAISANLAADGSPLGSRNSDSIAPHDPTPCSALFAAIVIEILKELEAEFPAGSA
jgi:hypothetical protein